MCSPEAESLSPAHRQILLDTARQSIEYGVGHGGPRAVEAGGYPAPLRPERATFVTLREANQQLRGCIGTSQAMRPLVEDVARNGYSAAFMDPRFTPMRPEELAGLDIQISVLTPLEVVEVDSVDHLLVVVRPGVDGLLIEEGTHRGTLLPSVWDVLPEPHVFLRELWLKAGLSPGHWSPRLKVYRYTTECFP